MSEDVLDRPSPAPVPRVISYADVFAAIGDGWRDLVAAPLISVVFGMIYALGGFLIYWILKIYQAPWMIVPIAIGFPLLGPFLAAGTYEVARRLRAGERAGFATVVRVMAGQFRREFAWMAFVVLFIFWIWMYQARVLIALFLDMQAFASSGALASALFMTADGITMLAIGTIIGGILATLLFTTTVVSMPMLIERDLDIVTAIIVSWKTVLQSPGPMLMFGAMTGALALLAMVPLFLGLLVIFPLLGYSTWHLYRRAIERP